MCDVLALGPFVGDFKQEIMVFRPYIKYICESVDYDKVYISSHSNRSFLYNWIPTSNFLPIYNQITREEHKQKGFTHTDIHKRDFTHLTTKFKKDIRLFEDSPNITSYNLPYITSTNSVSIYQKSFTPLNTHKISYQKDIVVLIPDKDFDVKIYNELCELFDVIVVGDMKCGLPEHNIILKSPNYFVDNYRKIVDYIQNAKFTITNITHWAVIVNLLNKPLLYQGNECSLFKSSGIYNFGNEKTSSINIEIERLPSYAKYFYEKMYGDL